MSKRLRRQGKGAGLRELPVARPSRGPRAPVDCPRTASISRLKCLTSSPGRGVLDLRDLAPRLSSKLFKNGRHPQMISKEQARAFGSVKGYSKKVRRTSDSISLICSVRSQLKVLKAPHSSSRSPSPPLSTSWRRYGRGRFIGECRIPRRWEYLSKAFFSCVARNLLSTLFGVVWREKNSGAKV